MKAKHIIGGILILGCLAVGAFSLKSSLTPYVSFGEARKSDRKVQVAGALVKDSTKFDKASSNYNFVIKDPEGDTIPVRTNVTLPPNFTQSTTVVAIGVFEDGTFNASNVLVKCPSKYDKKKGGEHPGEMPMEQQKK